MAFKEPMFVSSASNDLVLAIVSVHHLDTSTRATTRTMFLRLGGIDPKAWDDVLAATPIPETAFVDASRHIEHAHALMFGEPATRLLKGMQQHARPLIERVGPAALVRVRRLSSERLREMIERRRVRRDPEFSANRLSALDAVADELMAAG